MNAWIDVADLTTLTRRRRLVVEVGDHTVALFYIDGEIFALDNICTHKQRELIKGTILGDRIVCPGHQWAFNLQTGYEAKMCRYQPTFETRLDGDRVLVASQPSEVAVEVTSGSLDGPAA